MSETLDEKLSRVEMMASGDATWDLSQNDLAALRAVLKDRAWMQECFSSATRQLHEQFHAASVFADAIVRLQAKVAELEAEIADDHDSVRAVAKECRDMDADQIRNLETTLDQVTKERDEWKWMYEDLCK
jgi:hypothetical protein